MRFHLLFPSLLGVLFSLNVQAQTVSDSLSTTPTPATKQVQYAPGGYGPSAIINTGHFGFKVGPSLTSAPIQGVSPSIEKQKMDFHLGFLYRYRFTKFVLQPEVLYQLKGGTYHQFLIGSTNRTKTENNFN